jgi:Mrp family chromosome partitioning ATPase
MSGDGQSSGKRGGTYLFVKERRTPRRPSAPLPHAPGRRSRLNDSIMLPLEPPSTDRLRYLRPRLTAASLDAHLALFLEPQGDAAALYREMAGRLLEERPDLRRIWVTSPGRGAGKTITALNLASALAETMRVTVVDLHLASPGLGQAFGLNRTGGLSRTIAARRRERRAAVDLVMLGDRLAILPESAPVSPEAADKLLMSSQLRRVLDEVGEAADVMILDAPPLERADTVSLFAGLAPGALLVVRPTELGSGAYEAALDRLSGTDVVGVVVNGAPSRARRKETR